MSQNSDYDSAYDADTIPESQYQSQDSGCGQSLEPPQTMGDSQNSQEEEDEGIPT